MRGQLNEQEAPSGFYAVLKSSLPRDMGNLCRFCDWRKECQKTETDFENSNHRCMDFPVISAKTGLEIARDDGCSVVFKRVSNVAG